MIRIVLILTIISTSFVGNAWLWLKHGYAYNFNGSLGINIRSTSVPSGGALAFIPVNPKLLKLSQNVKKQVGNATEQIEEIASLLFDQEGYGSVRKKAKNKDIVKYNVGSDNGFDDIAIDPWPTDAQFADPNWFPNELIVIEAKPKNPRISLGTTNAGIQMSDKWIEATANKLIALGGEHKKLGDLILKAKETGKLSKALVALDKATGEILVQKLN
jgi:hypothetical protein